jgi:hypothetical protein
MSSTAAQVPIRRALRQSREYEIEEGASAGRPAAGEAHRFGHVAIGTSSIALLGHRA